MRATPFHDAGWERKGLEKCIRRSASLKPFPLPSRNSRSRALCTNVRISIFVALLVVTYSITFEDIPRQGLRVPRQPSNTAARKPAPAFLPHGWRSTQDMNGRTYYYHNVTKKSSWTFPDRRKMIFRLFPVAAPTCMSTDTDVVVHAHSDIYEKVIEAKQGAIITCFSQPMPDQAKTNQTANKFSSNNTVLLRTGSVDKNCMQGAANGIDGNCSKKRRFFWEDEQDEVSEGEREREREKARERNIARRRLEQVIGSKILSSQHHANQTRQARQAGVFRVKDDTQLAIDECGWPYAGAQEHRKALGVKAAGLGEEMQGIPLRPRSSLGARKGVESEASEERACVSEEAGGLWSESDFSSGGVWDTHQQREEERRKREMDTHVTRQTNVISFQHLMVLDVEQGRYLHFRGAPEDVTHVETSPQPQGTQPQDTRVETQEGSHLSSANMSNMRSNLTSIGGGGGGGGLVSGGEGSERARERERVVMVGRWWLREDSAGSFCRLSAHVHSSPAMHLFLIAGGPWLFEDCSLRCWRASAVKCCENSTVEIRGCSVGGFDALLACGDCVQARDNAHLSLANCSVTYFGNVNKGIRVMGTSYAMLHNCSIAHGAIAVSLEEYSNVRLEQCSVLRLYVAAFLGHSDGGAASLHIHQTEVKADFLWFTPHLTEFTQSNSSVQVSCEGFGGRRYTRAQRACIFGDSD